jgi:hypothetical protein
MTKADPYGNPEPVPPASQLAVLPFLAAVNGYLSEDKDVPDLRITVHRAMSREGRGYLQQVCAYLRQDGGDWRGKVGRTFAVDTGIIGAAYESGKVWRTKRFKDVRALHAALKKDNVSLDTVAQSWLAVPFLGPQDQVVLILYADCNKLNFFADDGRVRRIVAMSKGFCRLLDWLQKDPFENLRNFPLERGEPVRGIGGLYSFQEALPNIGSPRFSLVPSFNYEAAAA